MLVLDALEGRAPSAQAATQTEAARSSSDGLRTKADSALYDIKVAATALDEPGARKHDKAE